MFVFFLVLWTNSLGHVLFQPYKKAVEACLWANRVEYAQPKVVAVGFELEPTPKVHMREIDCKEAKEIDKSIK